jgi:hypothetical protein
MRERGEDGVVKGRGRGSFAGRGGEDLAVDGKVGY